MKKLTIICIILALLSVAIPLFLSYPVATKNQVNATSPTENAKAVFMDKNSEDTIIRETMKFADESYCDETLKALIVLVRNNLDVCPSENSTEEYEKNAEFSQRLKKLLKDTYTKLSYNGKKVYIPFTELSSGSISTSDEYPYINPTASPWDCLSPKFVYGKEYTQGISLFGIDYLCKEGSSYEEALAYYLEGFEIK